MTRKVVLLLSVALAGGLPAAQAQFLKVPDYTAELALIKGQPLVVLLEQPNPKMLRKLAGKREELTQYQANIALRNKLLLENAPKLWHYSPAVVFKPETEYEALRKASGTQTPVFYYVQGKESEVDGRANGPPA